MSFSKGLAPTATPLISTLARGGVPAIRSFSACVALVTKAKEINAIDACSRRKSSLGEQLYRMEMNPDGLCHKLVYGCAKFVVGSSRSEAHLRVQRAARFLGGDRQDRSSGRLLLAAGFVAWANENR